jgi:transcriptional regulator with XRE-family HTH domain
MSVNEKIKLVRQAKGLTQEAVAEKLGLSVTTYGDIERGDKDLKLSKLQVIADVLEMKASELLDLNDRTVLNVSLNRKYKGDNKVNVYFSSDAEIEKLQMQLDMKDKELAMKDREIAYLKELLDMHKNSKANLSESP